MGSLTLPSFAKINWTLDVLGRRVDGYHELRTVYQTVGLFDTIEVAVLGGASIDVQTDSVDVPGGPANLAHRAAAAFLDATELAGKVGVKIFIRKEIPAGGGLGGGSSNAAVTLLALEMLSGRTLQDADRFRIAATLGADVPLFLLGGTVLGVGRGDEVYALPDAPPGHLVIVNPGTHIETATVFRRFASELTPRDPAAIMPSFLSALRIDTLPPVAGNDLGMVVENDHPEVRTAREALLGAGAARAWMTGSGASVVGIFESAGAAVSAVEQLEEQGLWTRAVETVDRRSYSVALGL